MVNSKGVDTSILFGFTKMVLELINRENPTHIAVVFDPPVKTFRHEAYPEYKANRSAAPDLVKQALEPLQEILKSMNIPVLLIPGFEADDVIGSMAKQWQSDDSEIFMVTPDKDYGQLITDHIYQYKPAKGGNEIEVIGKEKICEQYGIQDPQQVIDILSIWGDSSDNIPGIKGIGEVGAKKLIGKYGSLKGVIENSKELPPKQQEALKEAMGHIEMSKFLVTIKTDISLPINSSDIKMKPIQEGEAIPVFEKYEFTSLFKLVGDGNGVENISGGKEKEEIVPAAYSSTIKDVIDLASQNGKLSFKLTTEHNIIISADDKYAFITKGKLEEFKNIAQNENVAKIGYNIKELIKILIKHDITLKGELFDIELMHYVINPERSHKEDMLIKSYLKIDINNIRDEEQEGVQQQQPEEFDLFSAAAIQESVETNTKEEASKKDGVTTTLLCKLSDQLIQELESSNQIELYRTIEAPLIQVLANMESQGVKIDTEHLHNYSQILSKELLEIENRVREIAEEPTLNISSPKQVGILLYEKLKLNPKVKRNSKGSYPTDEETLNELASSHQIIEQILEYRGLKKLLSTYIDNFPSLISAETGKIHTTFNQALTATGRLSSTNPNLQNIPIRTQRGREIRKAFIPSNKDGVIISADYSQIELRLMAHLSDDMGLVEAFNHNKDIHTATAAKVFKVEESEVTKEQRNRAKVANFGIIYGISAFGLSQRLGMSRTDSKQLIDEYFASYPGVKEYMNKMIEKAKESGYVETIYGRKRFLPDINSRNGAVRSYNERNAINAPLQGSAADIIKAAMINVYNRLEREQIKSKMILQVHDELVFDALESEIEVIKRILTEEMESVIKLHIPLITECGVGQNWLEAH